MAVKIRLARAGGHKAAFYRLVAADSRAPRDGRFIEILGRYNPRTDPSFIEIDVEKVDAWLAKGAQATETAAKLIAIAKNPDAAPPERKGRVSKKAAEKAAAEKKAAEEKAATPAPVEEPAAEEAPAEEPAAEEAPAEEPAAEEAPVEEPAAEEAPADAPAEPEAE